MRFRVDPRDVPPEFAARRLGLPLPQFQEMLPALQARGFPMPDPTTGNFDLDAIDEWRKRRNPHLFGLTDAPAARDAKLVVPGRLDRMRRSG
jgi:hypothetical protein